MARYASEGSNALSKGRSKKDITRFAWLRLERRSAIAKLKLEAIAAINRRNLGSEDPSVFEGGGSGACITIVNKFVQIETTWGFLVAQRNKDTLI